MNLHKLAHGLLDHAARVMPPSRRTWTRAMRAELEHIPGPVAASLFALGCVRACYSQRIEDMLTVAFLTRWTLSGLALVWAGYSALATILLIIIKADPDIRPADLGTDSGTAETLSFIKALPAWEVGLVALTAILLAPGAVQLARRRPHALPLLALGVGVATVIALVNRLTFPGADLPMGSTAGVLTSLICLAPAWWLSHRAPDLATAR